MKILVVGGAGYIGSHMVKSLFSLAHKVTTFDDLSKGYRDAVLQGEFIERDLADATRVNIDLRWDPKFSNLEKIIGTAWYWEQSFSGSKAGSII